eukprot:334779-Chlamydomonas_euryale.AAC.1
MEHALHACVPAIHARAYTFAMPCEAAWGASAGWKHRITWPGLLELPVLNPCAEGQTWQGCIKMVNLHLEWLHQDGQLALGVVVFALPGHACTHAPRPLPSLSPPSHVLTSSSPPSHLLSLPVRPRCAHVMCVAPPKKTSSRASTLLMSVSRRLYLK